MGAVTPSSPPPAPPAPVATLEATGPRSGRPSPPQTALPSDVAPESRRTLAIGTLAQSAGPTAPVARRPPPLPEAARARPSTPPASPTAPERAPTSPGPVRRETVRWTALQTSDEGAPPPPAPLAADVRRETPPQFPATAKLAASATAAPTPEMLPGELAVRLGSDAARALLGAATLVVGAPSEAVYRRGEPADALYIVVEGRFQAGGIDAGPGHIVGDECLVDAVRSEDAQVTERTLALRIPKSELDRVCESFPVVGQALLAPEPSASWTR